MSRGLSGESSGAATSVGVGSNLTGLVWEEDICVWVVGCAGACAGAASVVVVAPSEARKLSISRSACSSLDSGLDGAFCDGPEVAFPDRGWTGGFDSEGARVDRLVEDEELHSQLIVTLRCPL